MLWPCRGFACARLCEYGGPRPKDLGTLDGSRGGLIIPRRVKAAPGTDLGPTGELPSFAERCGLSGYSLLDRNGQMSKLSAVMPDNYCPHSEILYLN